MAKRKVIDKFDIFFYLFFAVSFFWNITRPESFTYFWLTSGALACIFLIYHGATWEKDIKRMAQNHVMRDKDVERD